MPTPAPILAQEGAPLNAPPASPATPMMTSAVISVASLVAEEPPETAAKPAGPEAARDEGAQDSPDDDEYDGAGSDFVVSTFPLAPPRTRPRRTPTLHVHAHVHACACPDCLGWCRAGVSDPTPLRAWQYDGGDDDARPKGAPPPVAMLQQEKEREELDRQRQEEEQRRKMQEQGVRMLHRVAAFTAGGEVRAWVACAPEAEAMLMVHGVRALQREVTQAQADAINAQVQLRLLEEDRGDSAAGLPAAADEESSARAELRSANERAMRLEAALAEQAVAFAAERADRSALARQHEAAMVAKDVELKELTSQLQRFILQRLEQQPKPGMNGTKGGASLRSTSR